jgi:hypothetical protein
MINIRLLRGPALILLYQALPLQAHQDSLGRYRLTVGTSGGQWEKEAFSCEGDLVGTAQVRNHSSGAQLDAWPAPQLRLSTFAGGAGQSIGSAQGSVGAVEDYSGVFGGAQIAYEGQRFGIGLGFSHLSGRDGLTAPSSYLRIGNIDGVHFRIDALSPSPVMPSSPWARIGVGWNAGHLRGTSGFFGVGVGPTNYNAKAVFAAEVRVPLARRLAAQFHGLMGPGEKEAQWGVGLGLRYDFGH